MILPGEGESKMVVRTHVRIECGNCSEPATHRHTYLLPNARSNRASNAYRHDDCSWCSDHEGFTCDDGKRPEADGYGWCSTFSIAPGRMQFAHMFLRWIEREVENRAT
jgi:hypothetical protein